MLSILYWCYLRATKNDVKPQVAVENCALFCCHVRSGIEIYVVVVDPCWKVAVPSSESTKWYTQIPGSAFVHPQGAEKMVPVRNEAHHVDLE